MHAGVVFLPHVRPAVALSHDARTFGSPWPPHNNRRLTRKSTPMVAVASSSGIHCSSEKRKRRLLLPTDALPMSSSLTLTGVAGLVPAVDVSTAVVLTGGIVDDLESEEPRWSTVGVSRACTRHANWTKKGTVPSQALGTFSNTYRAHRRYSQSGRWTLTRRPPACNDCIQSFPETLKNCSSMADRSISA